jgi:hypothetical protein
MVPTHKTIALFVWLINHQLTVLFSKNNQQYSHQIFKYLESMETCRVGAKINFNLHTDRFGHCG